MTAKDEAVINCANQVLISHGWSSPIDPNGTMGGYYKYKQPLMIAYHNQVAICLASKGYDYEYPHDDAYMNKTLGLTLLALYGVIDGQTKVGKPHLDRIVANARNLQAILPASVSDAPGPEAASLPEKKPKKAAGARKRDKRSKKTLEKSG